MDGYAPYVTAAKKAPELYQKEDAGLVAIIGQHLLAEADKTYGVDWGAIC